MMSEYRVLTGAGNRVWDVSQRNWASEKVEVWDKRLSDYNTEEAGRDRHPKMKDKLRIVTPWFPPNKECIKNMQFVNGSSCDSGLNGVAHYSNDR